MSRPRIFISHSAKEKASQKLLDALKTRLATEGFQVLLDKDGLELGVYWRSTLNLWIGGCDAAVMLLSEAALASRFVAYEASILSFRRNQDPSFRLIPIYLEPVDETKIKASPLEPSRITEVEASVVRGGWGGEEVDAVVEKLADLKRGDSPIEAQARRLRVLLGKIDDITLDQAAGALDVDLGTWVPGRDPREAVALKMIGAGLQRASDAIRMIRTEFPKAERTEKVEELVDLVGSSWVDYRAARRIPEVARQSGCLGGSRQKEPLAARMYVIVAAILAKNLAPNNSWCSALVDGVLGHNASADLQRSIRAALCEQLGITATEPFEECLRITTEREPVVVVLRAHPGITAGLLDEVRNAFPGVTFFLLFGGEPPSDDVLSAAQVEVLQPPLDPEFEATFIQTYRDSKTYLLRGLT